MVHKGDFSLWIGHFGNIWFTCGVVCPTKCYLLTLLSVSPMLFELVEQFGLIVYLTFSYLTSHVCLLQVEEDIKPEAPVEDAVPSEQAITESVRRALEGAGLREVKQLVKKKPQPMKPQRYRCKLCGMRFVNLIQLRQHKSSHKGEKPFKCPYCPRAFRYAPKYKEHVSMHEEKTDLQCPVCDKVFDTPRAVKLHVAIHDSSKPYPCDLCEASYTRKSGLDHHRRSVHTKERPFQCKVCEARFALKHVLRDHMRIHTGEQPFSCEVCGMTFRCRTSWVKHLAKHLPLMPPYNCTQCNQQFAEKDAIQAHVLQEHKDESDKAHYRCLVCGASFIKLNNLTKHESTHADGAAPFVCKLCDDQFDTFSAIKSHQRDKHPETCPEYNTLEGKGPQGRRPSTKLPPPPGHSFVCEICGKEFARHRYLENHKKLHSSARPFKCEVCGRAFKMKHILRDHMRTHTGETPFVCHICGMAYRHSQGYRSHLRTHSGEKPSKCEVCNATFSNKQALKVHSYTHMDEKPFKCHLCTSTFAQKAHLNIHLNRHSGIKPFKCDQCEKAFWDKGNLTVHMRKHTNTKPYKCDLCDKKFIYLYCLKYHKRKHSGERPFRCTICPAAFFAKGHLDTHMCQHTGQRPYVCELCGAAYTSSSTLKKHKFTHTGVKPFACDLCSATFATRYRLNRHQKGCRTRHNIKNIDYSEASNHSSTPTSQPQRAPSLDASSHVLDLSDLGNPTVTMAQALGASSATESPSILSGQDAITNNAIQNNNEMPQQAPLLPLPPQPLQAPIAYPWQYPACMDQNYGNLQHTSYNGQ